MEGVKEQRLRKQADEISGAAYLRDYLFCNYYHVAADFRNTGR
jgi:hypothetical protein